MTPLPTDEEWLSSGDADRNSRGCWQLAIAEIRRRGLREGRFMPETDEERAYVEAYYGSHPPKVD